jgi:hypothetical protein
VTACERCGTTEREVNLLDSLGAWLCLSCAEPHLPTGPAAETGTRTRNCTDPFARPLDRLLLGLRRHARDPYRLIPGEGKHRDRWLAVCPLHPSTGYSLALLERADGSVVLACAAGCPDAVIRELLDPDPERERRAAEVARWFVWAQTWKRRAA